jgi:uncharacterized protein
VYDVELQTVTFERSPQSRTGLLSDFMSSSSPSTRHAEPDELIAFRERRRRDATGRRGPASFVWGDFVTQPDSVVEGAPGRWAPLPDGRAGLLVRASRDEGIRIGDHLVDGNAILHAHEEDGPAIAEFPDGAEGVIFSYDGSKYALQVWNPRSAWTRRFSDIAAFPWDPDWKMAATLLPVAAGRTVAVTHHRDPRPVDVPVVAEVVFVSDGTEHRLLATPGGPGQKGLFVHFRDATNGSESYGAGRSVQFVPDGDAATLDFNYSTLLPCSFSLAWNCPLPPAENTLGIPVRAGERNAVDAQGATLL